MSMLQITKTKAFRISAVVVLLVALYALGGFVVAPRMLRSALMEDIPKTLGVTPTVGEIHVNPFLFRLEIKDFSLAAPSGEKLLGFGRLFVDFELSSIWHRAYSFADIDIDAPSVNAVVTPDGSLNLSQLRPKTPPAKTPPEKPQEKTGPLPAIRIGSFNVSKGLVTYEDHSRPSEFTARLEPINFALANFATGVEGGRFTFTASSKLGERVEWHGHLSVQPIESDGEFQIDGLHAHTIWEYLEDRLNFAVNSGTVDLNATYKFSLRDAVDLQATVSRIAVNDLAVRPKDADIDWIAVPSLLLSGTTVDLLKRQAHADSLSLTGVKVVTWLEPDGSLNLLKLAQSPPARAATAAAAQPSTAAAAQPSTTGAAPPPTSTATQPSTAAAAPPASATPPWKFDLRELTLREAEISAEDRGTSPAAKVLLAPLSVKVDGVSLDLAKPVTVALDTRINHTGSLTVSGDVTPQPLSANVSLKLDGVGLEAAQPYIAQRTSMTLISGRLSGDAKVRYGAKKPALEFAGNISVAGLHTVDNALHDDFINWDRLDVSGIAFQHDPDRLDIQQVMARKLYARVIIEPDTSLNVKRVLAGPGATVVAPPVSGGAPVATTAPLPAAPRGTPVSGKVAASKAAAGPPPAAAPPPMPMAIKKIVLHAGQTNFADLSVQPNFATGIQSIEGTVLGLSSNPNSRARVDIHGAVDAFSPVDITGDVNVLSAALYTDLALNFRNMELSIFNPYSGKFAGYNITKGKLTTELHYKVVGRKLDAQHHITVDQLEFGDKTASKDAVSLPIKLAVALLKDRHGVINLDIPVTGTLDDPTFRLGPIIWKVFVNILEKAVTAPFALIGALFGGGPDLQFVDFRPGAADLDPAAADKIRTMVKALNERPQLKIEVPIAWVGDLDRPALVEAQFLTQVREAQSAKAGRKKSPADAPDFEQLDTSAKVELLTQLYAKSVGGEPKFPQEVTNIKTKPELAAAKADFLKQALREHISVTDGDLTALGQQRAMAVQQALLTDSQVDPARVFLAVNDKAKNQDGKVRLELSLR
jgi:hypothetical protein